MYACFKATFLETSKYSTHEYMYMVHDRGVDPLENLTIHYMSEVFTQLASLLASNFFNFL